MFKTPLFKFLCVGLVSAVGGIGMFVGFMVYVLPSLAQLVPEPKINLASIGCPKGTVEDMNRKRCTINRQSEAALAYAMESAGLTVLAGETPNPGGAQACRHPSQYSRGQEIPSGSLPLLFSVIPRASSWWAPCTARVREQKKMTGKPSSG